MVIRISGWLTAAAVAATLACATPAAANPRCTALLGGTLCNNPHNPMQAVDVLVHGATYTGDTYWNTPGRSYVRRTLAAGRAAFVYDRTGLHGGVPSAEVGLQADADQLARIVTGLRSRYARVNVVGHSFGALVAQLAVANGLRVDALVLTSLHATGPALLLGEIVQVPANTQEHRFARFDPGWLTTPTGASNRAAFHAPTTPRRVLRYDDRHRTVVSSRQLADGRAQQAAPPAGAVTARIAMPVLLIVGTLDRLYCRAGGVGDLNCADPSTVLAREAPFYGGPVTVRVVPGAGHDLTLHYTADLSFALIDTYLEGVR